MDIARVLYACGRIRVVYRQREKAGVIPVYGPQQVLFTNSFKHQASSRPHCGNTHDFDLIGTPSVEKTCGVGKSKALRSFLAVSRGSCVFWGMERNSFVPKTWDLPDAIRRRLGNSVGRQRLMNEEGHLLLILHQAPKSEDDELRTAVLFWRNLAGEWKSTPTSGGLAGLDAHLALYRTAIHQLDEDVEAANTPRQYFEVMRRMHPLQRSTRNMAEVLQAARQALPDETRMINMRDQAVDLERGIELIAADAKAGMDFTIAEAASQQAASAEMAGQEARRLNRLAAFFFPLATLVAVFGMSPPSEVISYPHSWVVILSGIVLGLVVYSLVSARPRKGE